MLHFVFRKKTSIMPSMKLQSSDGEMFEVDVEIAKQSVTIKTMLEGQSSSSLFFLTHLCHAGFTVCDICLHYLDKTVCFICK